MWGGIESRLSLSELWGGLKEKREVEKLCGEESGGAPDANGTGLTTWIPPLKNWIRFAANVERETELRLKVKLATVEGLRQHKS